MKMLWSASEFAAARKQRGALGYILAWALGVPIPILLLIYMLRSCA
jgi:hypothetical protein